MNSKGRVINGSALILFEVFLMLASHPLKSPFPRKGFRVDHNFAVDANLGCRNIDLGSSQDPKKGARKDTNGDP